MMKEKTCTWMVTWLLLALGIIILIVTTSYAQTAVSGIPRDCTRWPAWAGLEARARAQYANATQREIAQFYALVQWNTDCRRKLHAIDRLISRVEKRQAGAN